MNATTTVAALLDAENVRDLRAMEQLLDPAVTFEMPFAPGGDMSVTGRDQLLALLSASLDAENGTFVDWRLDVSALYETSTPGVVFAEYAAEAVTRFGMTYRQAYVARFSVRGGSVTWWREWFNPEPLAAVMSETA
ncbi:nuclear transport factor 2 family protein [Nocardia cyriacigeorgica]|uniref:nuclear transport factor 2 family protein n=1 Tax=Nocardia cyriacigeorgica TaxID=135487 RepID=UPI001896111C|nr:nuclear transport factor 2 family protein [Nocardia cyriacigeorgica]MBF6095679.1 nuclear transport factor 2 family protein [Nocardia cyriacigeorgica]MBF6428506.1 nuclear transport factor 2 family protein [Nocardia cyriacigeorgica]